ncbi:DUF3833 domain-containing protein [Thaumasiovibrio sp. DFM-14]|uniref:DUF3833 domain-containing protein n=1 Tax=Thaumasiovibrio sp. DFM-14 TaxID=3384792 RepID=UPI0039A31E07
MHRQIILLVLIANLFACSASIEDYQEARPAFALFDFFEGDVTAWGMLQDYSNKQTRRFEAQITGTVTGDTITLDEKFLFDDGETQTRVWHIVRHQNGTFTGTASDVVGVATGRVVGNAFHWQYKLNVPVGEKEYVISLDDWLYRQDENHMFNLTTLRKFGITVGKLTLFFEKQPQKREPMLP